MYISVYNEKKEHLTNVDNITYDITQRVYDADNFTASGTSDVDVNNACFLILHDNWGNYKYACFCDTITPDGYLRTIKGKDFRTLLDTEVLLDYTKPLSYSPKLYDIFDKVCSLIFDNIDPIYKKINIEYIIPSAALDIDTTSFFGSLQDTYQIINAYKFLKGFLKFYEYNITSKYDAYMGKIIFEFVKENETIQVNLNDFLHELQTNSIEVNKAVATIKFNPISKDSEDNIVITPRPDTIATKYYYRTKDNRIIESDEAGDFEGWIGQRIYPVKMKIFEAEYLSEAQYNAVYELANARYVDNILLDNNAIVDPMDLSIYPLYTKFELYYEGKYFKTLPITEKHTKADASGTSTSVKLGFKKIYLTEVIKSQGGFKA